MLLGVFDLETFIAELLPENALSTSAIAFGEVSSLGHESGDDAMKSAILEMKHLS